MTNDTIKCRHCANSSPLGFDFTMAFQPIIDGQLKTVVGYEALVRGLNNESAYSVISQVTDQNRYAFDQQCRVKAIQLAAKLELDGLLSINFLPNAVYEPARCLRTTLNAAKKYQFPVERIMFEFTEVEHIANTEHLNNIISCYQQQGFKTATDDFGSGYSGLNLLTSFQPDIIKLDMGLLRGIDADPVRQAIVRHCLALCAELEITALAEGIETLPEYHWLKAHGVSLMQGYLFAKPAFEQLPTVDFSLLS